MIFLLLPISTLCQKYSFDSTAFFKQKKEIDLRKPSITSFKRNFENDSSDRANDFKNLKPFKIFKKSSTIYDVTKIILSSNRKFIAYYKGCTAEGVTAGDYQIENNILTISSSKITYESLKNDLVFKSIDYPFFEIGTIKYQIIKKGLVYLR